MTLYEIDNKMREILDHLFEEGVDPETGEVINVGTSYDEIEELAESRNKKLENIGMYLKELDATIDAYKKEQDRIKAKIKSLESKKENLEFYVMTSMQGNNEKKFESLHAEMVIRESEYVDIDNSVDPKELPEQYVKVKTEYAPDKTELKKALKRGEVFEGICLGRRYSLNVK